MENKSDVLCQFALFNYWKEIKRLGFILHAGDKIELGFSGVWHHNCWSITATSLNALSQCWLLSTHTVELNPVVETGIPTVSIASCCLNFHCERMITMALILDAHFKDWEWNSILDRKAVLMATKVAVVNIWASGWFLRDQLNCVCCNL